MGCGTPCIVVDEGGFKETIHIPELGVRIKKPYIPNLRKAVQKFNPENYDRVVLRKEAEKYGLDRFKEKMEFYVRFAVKRHGQKGELYIKAEEDFAEVTMIPFVPKTWLLLSGLVKLCATTISNATNPVLIRLQRQHLSSHPRQPPQKRKSIRFSTLSRSETCKSGRLPTPIKRWREC